MSFVEPKVHGTAHGKVALPSRRPEEDVTLPEAHERRSVMMDWEGGNRDTYTSVRPL